MDDQQNNDTDYFPSCFHWEPDERILTEEDIEYLAGFDIDIRYETDAAGVTRLI